MSKFFSIIAEFAFTLVMSFVSILIFSLVGSELWQWFFVPLGFTAIPYGNFIGVFLLLFLISIFVYKYDFSKKEQDEKLSKLSDFEIDIALIIVKILAALTLLAVGYLYAMLLL